MSFLKTGIYIIQPTRNFIFYFRPIYGPWIGKKDTNLNIRAETTHKIFNYIINLGSIILSTSDTSEYITKHAIVMWLMVKK